jgi:hypothetical protein
MSDANIELEARKIYPLLVSKIRTQFRKRKLPFSVKRVTLKPVRGSRQVKIIWK